MSRPIAKLLAGFVIAAVVMVLAAVIWTLNQPERPRVSLPNPNGYDELVKAGKFVTDNGSNYVTLELEGLRALVNTNAKALKMARTGLTYESRVPLDYSTDFVRLPDLSDLKRLARAFTAEARLAEVENRPGDAAQSCLDAIRVGYATSQGGLIIDSLVGVAIQAIGMVPLERVIPSLDAKQCRELASSLETAESHAPSAAAILEQEHTWSRQTYGLKGQLVRLVMYRSLQQTEQKFLSKFKQQQLRTRKLIIQLAARAYEQEKNDRPRNLADLVPEYLKAIPQDPLTGTNMVYRP